MDNLEQEVNALVDRWKLRMEQDPSIEFAIHVVCGKCGIELNVPASAETVDELREALLTHPTICPRKGD